MIAWPIDTSAVHGMLRMKNSRFSRFRSCPAFTARPHSLALSAVRMKGAMADFGSVGNRSAYGSVYSSTLSHPQSAAPSAIFGSAPMKMDVLIMDEPTANLDLKTGQGIIDLFKKLSDEDKEIDRSMAIKTLKLLYKLGYDIVKREDTELYGELLKRIRMSNTRFYCPECYSKGIITPLYLHQIFCDRCGKKLSIDWKVTLE